MQALRRATPLEHPGVLRPERDPERGGGGALLPERARGDGADRRQAPGARRGGAHGRRAPRRRALALGPVGGRARGRPGGREDRHSRLRHRGDRRPQVEQDGDQPEQRDVRAPGAVGAGGPGRPGGSRLHGRRLRGGSPGPAGGRDPVRGPAGQLDRGPDPEPPRAGDERHRPRRRGAAAPALALAGPPPRRGRGRGRLVQRGDRPARRGARRAHALQPPPAGADHRDGPGGASAPAATRCPTCARGSRAERPHPWRDRTASERSWPPGEPAWGRSSRNSGLRSSSSSAPSPDSTSSSPTGSTPAWIPSRCATWPAPPRARGRRRSCACRTARPRSSSATSTPASRG